MILDHKGIIRQFLAAYSACLLSLCYGSVIGWLSPVQTYLESDPSPVGKLTEYNIAWLASIPYVGSILGTFLFAYLGERIGRKTMLYGLAFTYLGTAIVINSTHDYKIMVLARFVVGICVPGTLSSISLYIAEISDPSIRGNLGGGVLVFTNMGVLTMFTGGAFLSYSYYNIILIVLPTVFIAVFWLLPESPVYHLKRDRIAQSKQALSWLKATTSEEGLELEVEKLRAMFFDQTSGSSRVSLTWREVFATKYYRKAFFLGTILMAGASGSGIMVYNTFAYTILGQCLDEKHPGKYVAFFPCLGTATGILFLFLTHRFTRKFILIGTRVSCATATFIIGVLLLLKDHGIVVPSYYFLALFTIYHTMFGMGLSSIIFVIFGELFSVECRDKFLQSLLLLHFVLIIIYVTLYPITVIRIHLYSWFFIFSSLSLILALILTVYLPETSNKTISEIAQELTRNSKDLSVNGTSNNELANRKHSETVARSSIY